MPANDNAVIPSHEDELNQLLALALDGADETRLLLMTRLVMMNLDAGLDADIDRLRLAATTPRVVRL